MTDHVSETALVSSPTVPAGRRYEAPGTRQQLALRWMRRNLFSSIPNTLLTILVIGIIALVLPPFFTWAVAHATWAGDSRDACTGDGACWTFVKVHLGFFAYGSYPIEDRWRVDLVAVLLVLAGYPVLSARTKHRGWWAVLLFLVFPVVAGVLLVGGVFGLRYVDTSQWGGLTLDFVITFVNASAALPIGVLLALGRQSNAPVVRMLATGYIEFWRGVPLLSVLFIATLMLPLFLPNGVSINNLLRLMVAMVMFYSAYMAEVIRGGLQGVPKGQIEAASSLGLKWWQFQITVVLPQAFRFAVPNITNTVVDLFKDTTLVTIIGLADVFGSVSRALNDTAWLGMATEGYVFTAVVFFVCCWVMSSYGRHFERRLNRHRAGR
jgi:general L-amino acid transport system permease protein